MTSTILGIAYIYTFFLLSIQAATLKFKLALLPWEDRPTFRKPVIHSLWVSALQDKVLRLATDLVNHSDINLQYVWDVDRSCSRGWEGQAEVMNHHLHCPRLDWNHLEHMERPQWWKGLYDVFILCYNLSQGTRMFHQFGIQSITSVTILLESRMIMGQGRCWN